MKVGIIYAFAVTLLLSLPGIESIDTALCLEACRCLPLYDPICVSNGKTYGNLCQLQCAQRCDPCLKSLYKGACKGCCRRMAELSGTVSHSSEENDGTFSTHVPSASSGEHDGSIPTNVPSGSSGEHDGSIPTNVPSGSSGEHDGNLLTEVPPSSSGEHDGNIMTQLPLL